MTTETPGYTVRDDGDDDPVLIIQPSGAVVDTWRKGYPYDDRMTREDYVLFDRSWYNRAGVERVMGFCSAKQHAEFIRQVDPVRQWKLSPTDLASLEVGRVHRRQGGDVRVDGHRGRPVDRRQQQRQEACPHQRDAPRSR